MNQKKKKKNLQKQLINPISILLESCVTISFFQFPVHDKNYPF